ncbi:hypothetical protein BCR44DRAFT_1457064 [Catenaria anguillulae PL171]|uniref:Uncharacterized protein n=1 Tax=Catenaria anguillulae PL171 TaxID=765915 RepID=A0A1Y2I3R4_9FUNG|nr:hypothetical protein BCR44DRAFT_1457064 [Catenaria anguillulae PL171]
MDPSDSDSQMSSSSAPTPTVSLRSSDAAAALAALGRAFLAASDNAPSQSVLEDPRTQVPGSSSSLSSLSGSDLGSCIPSGPTGDEDSVLPTTMSPAMLMYGPPDLYHHPHCPPYFASSSSAAATSQPASIMMPSYLGPNDHSMAHHHVRHISAGEDFDALSPMMGSIPGGLRTTSASSGSGMQTPQYGHSNVASPLVLHAHRRGAVSPPTLPPSSVFLDAMARASASVSTDGLGASVKGARRARGTPGAVNESGSASSLEAEHPQGSRPTVATAAGEGSTVGKRGPVTRRMAMRQQQPPASSTQQFNGQETLPVAAQTRRGIRRVTRLSTASASEDDHDLSYPSSADTSPNSDALTLAPPNISNMSHPQFTDDNLSSSSSEDNNDDDDDDIFTDPESTPNRRRAARSSASRRMPRASSVVPGPTTTTVAATGTVDGNQLPISSLASVLNDRLTHLESIIDLTALSAPPHMRDFTAQRRAFKATVNAVSAIVAEKLYKCRDMSLEDYFRTKFRISRAQVYRVVDSATVLRDLEELETTWDYARAIHNRARATATATNEGGEDAGEDHPPGNPRVVFPLPVKQRVCAAIKSCAGNKQDRQELWKTLCMRVAPQAASSKDVKETWDWLVAQGRVTPKNGRRGSTVPPDLGEVMAATAAAVAEAGEETDHARAVNASMPPPVMPPPKTKRAGQSRKRSATAAASGSGSGASAAVQAASRAEPASDGPHVANAGQQQQQQEPGAAANSPDAIELPPPTKRLRRSASLTALQAITTPASVASSSTQASITTPPRQKPKGTRRRPASLAQPVAQTQELRPPPPPPQQQQQHQPMDLVPALDSPATPYKERSAHPPGNLVPALVSPKLPPIAPSPPMSTSAALELAQALGSPMGSPSTLQFPPSPAVAGVNMMNAPAAVRPGHYLSLSTSDLSPSLGSAALSASGSPSFFHPQARHQPSVGPSNLFITSPSISPTSLTMSAPLSPAQFVTSPMLFASSMTSSSATTGAASTGGAIPATLTGGPIKSTHASLIETAISTLQQLQDAGIQLEPCFNGTWVSGINQFRFRKHGEFVSAAHPHSASEAATSSNLPPSSGNLLGLHNTGSTGGSPMLAMPGYASAASTASIFTPGSPSSNLPSITIPADDLAPAAMPTSFTSSSMATGTRTAGAGGMATAASPSVVQQHEAAMRLARLAAAAAAATTTSESVVMGGKLGRSDTPGTGSPMQVSPRMGSAAAASGEVGASQSR